MTPIETEWVLIGAAAIVATVAVGWLNYPFAAGKPGRIGRDLDRLSLAVMAIAFALVGTMFFGVNLLEYGMTGEVRDLVQIVCVGICAGGFGLLGAAKVWQVRRGGAALESSLEASRFMVIMGALVAVSFLDALVEPLSWTGGLFIVGMVVCIVLPIYLHHLVKQQLAADSVEGVA